MPIINNNKKTLKYACLKEAKVNPTLLKQIEDYCQWAGIYDIGYFIEKVTENFLKNDVEWNSYLLKQKEDSEVN